MTTGAIQGGTARVQPRRLKAGTVCDIMRLHSQDGLGSCAGRLDAGRFATWSGQRSSLQVKAAPRERPTEQPARTGYG